MNASISKNIDHFVEKSVINNGFVSVLLCLFLHANPLRKKNYLKKIKFQLVEINIFGIIHFYFEIREVTQIGS